MAWFLVGLLLGLISGFVGTAWLVAQMISEEDCINGEWVKRKEKDGNPKC